MKIWPSFSFFVAKISAICWMSEAKGQIMFQMIWFCGNITQNFRIKSKVYHKHGPNGTSKRLELINTCRKSFSECSKFPWIPNPPFSVNYSLLFHIAIALLSWGVVWEHKRKKFANFVCLLEEFRRKNCERNGIFRIVPEPKWI